MQQQPSDERFDRLERMIVDTGERLTETMRDIETHMLTEFHRYARGQQARMQDVESSEHAMKLRMAALEERVLELEGRIRPKH